MGKNIDFWNSNFLYNTIYVRQWIYMKVYWKINSFLIKIIAKQSILILLEYKYPEGRILFNDDEFE